MHRMSMKLTISIWKGDSGEYIGQCNELKGIIVHGKSEAKVKKYFKQATAAYFDAFPEERVKSC